MQFLVEIRTNLPLDWADNRRIELLDRERVRGEELRDDGTIAAVWRIPGSLANVGIWSAPDATALHAALTSLPVWPWTTIRTTALADHPLMTREYRPAEARPRANRR